jgi:2-dehydropantoate 2-reductase
MPSHTHLIFGAGLIGTYLGSILACNKQQVQLFGRTRFKHAYQGSVKLTDYQQQQLSVDGLNFIDQLGECVTPDIIWLTVKCTGIKTAVEQLKAQNLISQNSIILCCQNGLGSDIHVRQAFPDNRILREMVPFNVVEMGSGHLHRGSGGSLTIETDPNNSAASLSQSINHAMLPATTTTNMNELLWAKLQLNISNSVNALADMPLKAMLMQRSYRILIAKLMEELLIVANVKQLTLPKLTALPAAYLPLLLKSPTWLFKRLASSMLAIDEQVRLSMWWDLQQGRKTEIDFLNGAVICEAEQLGIACSANRLVYGAIKQVESAKEGQKSQQKFCVERILYELQ